MRFSGFLKETPVCKKKTHHKNIQKSRDKGQKLAQSLVWRTANFFFSPFSCPCEPGGERTKKKEEKKGGNLGRGKSLAFVVGLEG